MNLTRCQRGHFYDADANSSCPHCGHSDDGIGITVPIDRTPTENEVTVPISGSDVTEPITVTEKTGGGGETIVWKPEGMSSEVIPVVGWLVCIKGEHIGQDFRLVSGNNFIGRDKDMDVVLSKDGAVSRKKHSIVIYEPKKHTFLVGAGDSHQLTYLNGDLVTGSAELKRNDVISLGDTDLMFFPCCDENFNWNAI